MENKNDANVRKYHVLSSVYDWFARIPLLERPRKRQFELADIQPGDRVLIVGVGTGLDLLHTPVEATVTGIDLSTDMLRRAKLKAADQDCLLRPMNAECASPVHGGHLGSGCWVTVSGRGSGRCATGVPVGV